MTAETRIIKFRVWDGKQMYFFNLRDLYNEGLEVNLKDFDSKHLAQNTQLPYENMPVMQYTGLKDKNGIEIYEGDILTCQTKQMGFPNKGVVVYCNAHFAIETNNYASENTDQLLHTHFWNNENFEIIGNIHSNQNL